MSNSSDICTDCESRRGFLGKASKLLAGGALAAAGVLGGDRWLQGKFAPAKRTLNDTEIQDVLQAGPQAGDSEALRQAIASRDVEWIRANLRADADAPGQAGAICNYCYYQYENRSSTSCIQAGCNTSCWRRLVCYDAVCHLSYYDWVRVHCCNC